MPTASQRLAPLGRVLLWPFRALSRLVLGSVVDLVGWAERSGTARMLRRILDGPQGRLVPYFRWDGAWLAGARFWVSQGDGRCRLCGLDMLLATADREPLLGRLWYAGNLDRGFGWSLTGNLAWMVDRSAQDLGLGEPEGPGAFSVWDWGTYAGAFWRRSEWAAHLRVGWRALGWTWRTAQDGVALLLGQEIEPSPAESSRRFGPAVELALSYGRRRPDFRPSRSWERGSVGPVVFLRAGLSSSVSGVDQGWELLVRGEAWWTIRTNLGRWTAWLEADMAHDQGLLQGPAPLSLGGIRIGRGLPPAFSSGGSLLHGSLEFRRLILRGIEGLLFVDWDLLAGLDFRDWNWEAGLWSAGGRLELTGLGDFAAFVQLGFAEQSFVAFAGLGRRL